MHSEQNDVAISASGENLRFQLAGRDYALNIVSNGSSSCKILCHGRVLTVDELIEMADSADSDLAADATFPVATTGQA